MISKTQQTILYLNIRRFRVAGKKYLDIGSYNVFGYGFVYRR